MCTDMGLEVVEGFVSQNAGRCFGQRTFIRRCSATTRRAWLLELREQPSTESMAETSMRAGKCVRTPSGGEDAYSCAASVACFDARACTSLWRNVPQRAGSVGDSRTNREHVRTTRNPCGEEAGSHGCSVLRNVIGRSRWQASAVCGGRHSHESVGLHGDGCFNEFKRKLPRPKGFGASFSMMEALSVSGGT